MRFHDVQVTAVCACGATWWTYTVTTRPERYKGTHRLNRCLVCVGGATAEAEGADR